ncbi:hypothetical protein ACP70R_025590 [Stipagrostis hirtigluma subsp. patula]
MAAASAPSSRIASGTWTLALLLTACRLRRSWRRGSPSAAPVGTSNCRRRGLTDQLNLMVECLTRHLPLVRDPLFQLHDAVGRLIGGLPLVGVPANGLHYELVHRLADKLPLVGALTKQLH